MATLTVSVKEAITLNNVDYGSERSLDISSVNEVVKRVVTASTTECGLIGFISAISGVGVTAIKLVMLQECLMMVMLDILELQI